MEKDTKDIQSPKKGNKMLLVKSIILSAVVLVVVAVVVSIIIKYQSSNRLSKAERECYNEVTMLYNESIATSYEAADDDNVYEVIVEDTSSHMRMMENILVSTSFKYKEADESTNLEYKNQVTLTYTGLNSIKSVYTLWYNNVDGVYDGLIKCDEYNVGSFTFQETDSGYKTSITGGNGGYTYSVSYENNLYTFTKASTVSTLKTSYTYNTKTDVLTLEDNIAYTYGLNGTSIQITKTDGTDTYVATVTTITKDSKYMYEYSFLASGKDTTKYDVSR